MEPRPQSPRSSQGQQPAGSGRASEETGAYQQQPDTASAPQRSDYDYSPLDLAPPGQRRRRQLVAAVVGGAVILLLTAASVFAIIALRGDGDDDATDLAALQTQIATLEAAGSGTPDVAASDSPGDEVVEPEPTEQDNDPAGADDDEDVERVVAQPGESESESTEPTSAPAETGTGPSQGELEAMLPGEGTVPQGLDAVENTSRTEEEVVGALGGNREAETNLDQWGWSANVERRFTASDPAALLPEATTDITVSLHGFASDQAAADALTFYSDILALGGYEDVEAGDIGATNRLLRLPQEDGGTTVALYVQEGPVLYRIGGYSPGGDPTTNIVNVAQAMISE